jgi:glycosyltransferase involved in cell wall biosynthesis
MTIKKPKITVVTPSYNQARYLEKTITSVLSQGYDGLEYIVLDGGSTDGSVDIIKKYSQDLAYWQTGPDDGQACAIQHGWQLATGDVLCWLNSDDMLMPGALDEVARQYQLSDWVLLAGRSAIIDQYDRPLHMQVPKDRSIEIMLTWGHGLSQMATFYRSNAVAQIGGIDTSLSFSFDFDLFIRLKQLGRFQFTDRCFSAARLHSESKTSCILDVGLRECGLISRKYSSVPMLETFRSFMRRHDISFELGNRLAWTMRKQSVIDGVAQTLARGEAEAAKLRDRSGIRRDDLRDAVKSQRCGI